jgi:hypothetical protein
MNFVALVGTCSNDPVVQHAATTWWDALVASAHDDDAAFAKNICAESNWPVDSRCRKAFVTFCEQLSSSGHSATILSGLVAQFICDSHLLVTSGSVTSLHGEKLSKIIPALDVRRYLGLYSSVPDLRRWATIAALRPDLYLDRTKHIQGRLPVAFWSIEPDLRTRTPWEATHLLAISGVRASPGIYMLVVTRTISTSHPTTYLPTCWDAFTHPDWVPPTHRQWGYTKNLAGDGGTGVREVVTPPWEVREVDSWTVLP